MLEKGTSLTVGSHTVTIIRYLSEGGFSKIYEVGMDPEGDSGKTACLKQVLVRDKAGLATLRKEVDVMKQLRKARSIVRYYDSNAETLPDGTIQVLVLMELCPNNSLLHFMNDRIRQKLTEKEILTIMMDISIGIYEMHKLNLVHRDIKIENVLIDAKNRFKLCDFGSVSSPIRPPKDQQEFQILSHDILYQTTPQYRAPEMIDLYRGIPIDERSDIWAFGCFLYKLCYYTTPFEASGDIAILHASFQFLQTPAYSGDLKNLIIIMLQENPTYRPNIVQIIMLLAKMMQKDFDTLSVEDFYNRGPYDFQALHEMQKEKHNEQLKRQQYYYEQQLQQQKYEMQQKLSLSSNSLHLHLPNIPGQHTSHSSKSAGQETDTHEGRKSLEIKRSNSRPNSVKSTTTASSLEALHSLNMVIPDSKDSGPATETLDSPEIENFTEDFPDIENVAERYPSLDDIDQVVPTNNDRKATHEPIPIQLPNLDVHGGSKYSELVKTPLRTEFVNAEAWQKLPRAPIDKDAEKLVEDIFVHGSPDQTPHLRSEHYLKKSLSDRSFKGVDERLNSTPSTANQSPELWKNEAVKNIVDSPANQAERSRSGEETQAQGVHEYFTRDNDKLMPQQIAKPYSDLQTEAPPIPNRVKNPSFYQAPPHLSPPDSNSFLLVAQHEIRRENSNPWGSALEPIRQHSAHRDLNSQVANMSLNDSTVLKAETENLIDFADTEVQKPATIAIANTKMTMKPDMEVSLLDMEPDITRKNSDGKPKFKKKLSTMQPQQLEFQEQVIDFASDDENNNSQMSRVSIRNSLKKSRKTSDHHRRSESVQGEGKKRLSFFGNSD